jgi:hypothetical protein
LATPVLGVAQYRLHILGILTTLLWTHTFPMKQLRAVLPCFSTDPDATPSHIGAGQSSLLQMDDHAIGG